MMCVLFLLVRSGGGRRAIVLMERKENGERKIVGREKEKTY